MVNFKLSLFKLNLSDFQISNFYPSMIMNIRFYIRMLWATASFLAFFSGCKNPPESTLAPITIDYTLIDLPEKPNIIWIVAEDLSPVISCYGDSTVSTPSIERLANEGVKYTNFYSPSGVCAPSRSAIALGMYPTRIGTNHMRNGPWRNFAVSDEELDNYNKNLPEGIHPYEAMPPANTHMLSTYLRSLGYYCTNNQKQDYQFRSELTAWDESSRNAHWKNRQFGQPFFSIFNLNVTHESRIWVKANDSLWVDENLEVPVPPYLPDTELAKKDIRRMYSNVKEMDHQVGELIRELEEAGELENTIVFWYTDHGGPLPRQKRTVYDSGLRVPLIVRFPQKQLAGMVDSQLLSFIDLKPTVLSLAGMRPPIYVDGQAWMGDYPVKEKRKYIHAAADRFDFLTDRIRAVRNNRYKYIRNYILDQPIYLDVAYRKNQPIMQELLRLREENSLDSIQRLWFAPEKQPEELYDTYNDPHEINNLSRNPEMQAILAELSNEMDTWINRTNDFGLIPEKEYLQKIWPDGVQPQTEKPTIIEEDNYLTCTSPTEGASLGYQWVEKEGKPLNSWMIYDSKMEMVSGKSLYLQAHRLGFRPSEIVIANY